MLRMISIIIGFSIIIFGIVIGGGLYWYYPFSTVNSSPTVDSSSVVVTSTNTSNNGNSGTTSGENLTQLLATDVVEVSAKMSQSLENCAKGFDQSKSFVKSLQDANNPNPDLDRFIEVWDRFVTSVKQKFCDCLIENIKKEQGQRRATLCATNQFQNWDTFSELLGFPCTILKDKHLFYLIKAAVAEKDENPFDNTPQIIPPLELGGVMSEVCKCLLNRLKAEYATPEDLFNEFEWFVKQDNQQAMEQRIIKLINDTVDMCLKDQPICSENTFNNLREYMINNSESLFKGMSASESTEMRKEIELLLLTFCQKRQPAYGTATTKIAQYGGLEVMGNTSTIKLDPFFKPLEENFANYPF